MNLIAAGIDYSMADIDEREGFSLTTSQKISLYQKLKERSDLVGVVILSTCNRMEVFFSCNENQHAPNPFKIICEILNKDFTCYQNIYRIYNGDDVIRHLCLLSCGAESQIFGEDQIITQVKDAITFAREQNAADSILEVVFRSAITCGKRIRTDMNLTKKNIAISDKVIETIRVNQLPIQNILVIGNGKMGRRAAEDLVEKGFNVYMTVRQYKYKEVEIPNGVTCIEYGERYDYIEKTDAVVSATLSPHFTIEREKLAKSSMYPLYYFDLAVPRDIEKSVEELNGVKIYDVDMLSGGEGIDSRKEKIKEMEAYIEKYKADIYKWEKYHNQSVTEGKKIQHMHFPLFIKTENQKVLIVGGGRIARRRIKTLLKFNFNIVVIAPETEDEIKNLADSNKITLITRDYCKQDLSGACFVVAATNNRTVNHNVAMDAKAQKIPVSAADCKEECDFYFPAIIERENIVIGVVGDGTNHKKVAEAAAKIRNEL